MLKLQKQKPYVGQAPTYCFFAFSLLEMLLVTILMLAMMLAMISRAQQFSAGWSNEK